MPRPIVGAGYKECRKGGHTGQSRRAGNAGHHRLGYAKKITLGTHPDFHVQAACPSPQYPVQCRAAR
jgi:hypothetical protein